ncbi:hypothetical protein B0A55_08704 [Friedmanniomyces simplex]|uniref:Uncharacterized protein n=1 Tax=Friedmanniomyces simplex TaxID=329884 RepID=A0A4U0WVA2_9PEZI|nr:hypothetical protein B0A55_08704 [Friedmanniomyces simplex]
MKSLTALLVAVLASVLITSAEDTDVKQKVPETPTILQDPLLHIGFACNDVSKWTEQAAKDVKGELDKVDLGDAGKWLDQAGKDIGAWTQQAAKDVKGELDKIDLGDAGQWLDQAGRDIVSWTKQALRDIRAETDKIDMTGASEWIRGAARDIQQALEGMDSDGFPGWLRQATRDIGVQTALEDLQYVKLEELPTEAWEYIHANPGQTVFYVVGGVAFIAPGVVYGPTILGTPRFGANGVRAASIAANTQKVFGGFVSAAGWFAHLTSAGAGGYGAGLLHGVTRLGAVAVGAVKAGIDRAQNATSQRPEV